MKRIFTLTIASALIGTFASQARQLTPEEAFRMASTSPTVPAKVRAQSSVVTPMPVYTATADNLNTLYVFNSADGYIVTSADDVAAPLLGYSDNGKLDPADMPADLRWWLDCYSAQIASAANAGATPYRVHSRVYRPSVAPITKTLWNQDAPYNDLCPELTVNGVTNRAVTGCVATAMAQVMKTHNWPASGVGSNSYTFSYQGTRYPQSFDFGATTFDWDNMLDSYTGQSTAAQQQAVATLMRACGMAVNMSYGWASTGGSGAVSYTAARGLVDYFNYDKGVRYLPRQYFTYEEWVETIYNEVSAGRPVLLGGQSAEGGHEFVCDGYGTDDYFHINWGWGGVSDGYFLLSALDPPSQGIGGGSNDGFNMSQDAIVGIQPPVEGSSVVPTIVLQGDFMVQQPVYNTGDFIPFGAQGSTFFYSLSIAPFDMALGVKLVDQQGNVSYVASGSQSTINPNTGTSMYYINSANFAPGTYTVTPACQSGDQWYDVLVSVDNVRELTMTVTDDEVVFAVPSDQEEGIEISDFEISTPIYIGSLCDFSINVEAEGDFYGTIIPALVSGGSAVATAEPKGLSFEPGDTVHVEWVTDFSGSNLTPGTYSLVFLNSRGQALSALYEVEVLARQTETPTMVVESVAFPGCQGEGTYTDPYIITDTDNMEAIVTLTGTKGYWADNVVGEVFNLSTGRSVNTFGSSFAGVTAGNSTEVTLTGKIDGLDNGTTYVFLPWGGTAGQLTNKFSYIKIDYPTGVESTVVTPTDTPAVYYNLQGVRVANPGRGLYIVRRGDTASTVLVK